MRPEVRDALPGEIAELEGCEFDGWGRVAVLDGKVIGWLGVRQDRDVAMAFSVPRPEMRRFPLLIVREVESMMARFPHLYASPTGEREAWFLRRLGWRRYGVVAGAEVYEWTF